MVTTSISGLPVVGQELDLVLDTRCFGGFYEHIFEPGMWIYAMDLAGEQHGVDDSGSFSGFGGPDKEPVFLPNGRRAYFVFDEVVVDLGLAVVEVERQAFPARQGVRAGLSEIGLGQATALGDRNGDFRIRS